MGKARNPFRELMDHMSEMTRMRSLPRAGERAQKISRGPTQPPGSRPPTYSPGTTIW